MALFGHGLEQMLGILDQLRQAHVLAGELDVLHIHAHQRQKVGHDGGESVDFAVDIAQKFRPQPRFHFRLIDQRFNQDFHRSQRGFQLMAGIGYKLVARLIERFDLFAHTVERARQAAHFARAAHLDAGGKIAARHGLNTLCQG